MPPPKGMQCLYNSKKCCQEDGCGSCSVYFDYLAAYGVSDAS